MISLPRSRDKSGEMKQLRPLRATPASYWFVAFKSFLIMLVVSMRSCKKCTFITLEKIAQQIKVWKFVYILTSVPGWNVWLAARYPIRLLVNLLELITSMMLNPAHDMSYPHICSCKQKPKHDFPSLSNRTLAAYHFVVVVIAFKLARSTHVCKFGNGIALHLNVVDSQLLLDLLDALSDVVRLKRKKIPNINETQIFFDDVDCFESENEIAKKNLIKLPRSNSLVPPHYPCCSSGHARDRWDSCRTIAESFPSLASSWWSSYCVILQIRSKSPPFLKDCVVNFFSLSNPAPFRGTTKRLVSWSIDPVSRFTF